VAHARDLRAVAGELQREILDPGVVADQHRRLDLVGDAVEHREQLSGGRGVELGLDAHLDLGREPDPLQRLTRALRGRAQHQPGRDALGAHALADRLRGAPPALRQRPVVVGEPRLVPARLRVAEEKQPLHDRHDCALA
jgi:hypothetical protein